jgi:nitroreductase
MTTGYPKKVETRNYPKDYKRKNIKEIVIGDFVQDNLLESVRIAPSAVNLQPWLIEKIDKKYNFYIKPAKSLMEKMIKSMRFIDMGIAIAHLFVQAKADGLDVSFGFESKDIKQGKFTASLLIS